jgi:hypothetical protein
VRLRWGQILLGALLGAACALAVGQWNLRRLRAAQDAFQKSIRDDMDRQRTQSMAQLAVASVAQANGGASVAASPPAPAAPPVARPAAARLTPQESWSAGQIYVRKHLAEPVDVAWKARVTPALESDMKVALGRTKGTLGSLNCRSSSCLGTIKWRSLAEARREVQQLMTAYTRVNCPRSAMIRPDATDLAAPVEVEVLYDCSAWKADGSEIPPKD